MRHTPWGACRLHTSAALAGSACARCQGTALSRQERGRCGGSPCPGRSRRPGAAGGWRCRGACRGPGASAASARASRGQACGATVGAAPRLRTQTTPFAVPAWPRAQQQPHRAQLRLGEAQRCMELSMAALEVQRLCGGLASAPLRPRAARVLMSWLTAAGCWRGSCTRCCTRSARRLCGSASRRSLHGRRAHRPWRQSGTGRVTCPFR